MAFDKDLWDLLLATKRETRSIGDRIAIQRRELRRQREEQLAQAFAAEARRSLLPEQTREMVAANVVQERADPGSAGPEGVASASDPFSSSRD